MKSKIFVILILSIVALLFLGCSDGLGYSGKKDISYEICATYLADTEQISGEVKVDYLHDGEDTLTHMLFSLYPNLYREKGGGMEIKGVYVDGAQVGFSQRGEYSEILDVPLTREIFPDEKVSVVINYDVDIPEGDGIIGYSEGSTRISGWYPALCVCEESKWVENVMDGYGDYLYTECADYVVRLTVDEKEVVASSAKRTGQISSQGNITYTYEGEDIRDFALCLSPEFEVVSGVCGSTLISVYAYSEEVASEVLIYAKQAFALYSEQFGAYSSPVYTVVMTELSAGGMEFSGLTYVNCDLLGEELEEVVAHETAHQWWYGAVGSNPTEYAWLDEGLTEYSVLGYIKKYRGVIERENRIREVTKAYSVMCDVEKNLTGRCDFPLTQRTTEFTSEYNYVMVTYYKGMLFFENLRAIVGESVFSKALKTYHNAFYAKQVTPQDFCEVMQSVADISFEPFFTAWEEGRVVFCP